MKRLLAIVLLTLFASFCFAQSAVIRGESSAGNYVNIKADSSGYLSQPITDPCASASVAKSSVTISITSAATTSLVAPSGTTTIYVCSISMTISQVVTTANTIKFQTGTGATCGTGTADKTAAFGTGGVTAGVPIVVATGSGATIFSSAAGDRLCAVTTIGASAAFMGVLTYVQQ